MEKTGEEIAFQIPTWGIALLSMENIRNKNPRDSPKNLFAIFRPNRYLTAVSDRFGPILKSIEPIEPIQQENG